MKGRSEHEMDPRNLGPYSGKIERKNSECQMPYVWVGKLETEWTVLANCSTRRVRTLQRCGKANASSLRRSRMPSLRGHALDESARNSPRYIGNVGFYWFLAGKGGTSWLIPQLTQY